MQPYLLNVLPLQRSSMLAGIKHVRFWRNLPYLFCRQRHWPASFSKKHIFGPLPAIGGVPKVNQLKLTVLLFAADSINCTTC